MTYPEVVPESRILPLFSKEKNSGTTPESQLGPCPQKTEKPRAMRILVVDDEGLIADSVAEILSDNGYEAHAAYSGKSAIESAHDRCPDILMSDVLMPHLNGVETAKAIQAICPKVRILLFSGQAGTIDLLQQARSEGYDFELLSKPIHPDQLLKRLS